jgi:glucosamine--fructose-6-phosphate aminotransferase (isomerizing)
MPRTISDYRLYPAIQSQPAELARLLEANEPIEEAARVVAAAARVFTIGIGTSSNAAAIGASMLRDAGVDARAWSSHDFAAYPPDVTEADAAIVYTHSGGKQFSLRSLELLGDRGVPTVLLTSTESQINLEELTAPLTVLRTTTREPSAMFTFSHTATMMLSARIADALRPGAVGDLSAVPAAVEEALALEGQVETLARAWQGKRTIIGLGAGPHEPTAHELAIKVPEAARVASRGYALEQFLHGPQIQTGTADAFMIFTSEGPALERAEQAAAFLLDFGCDVAWVAPVAGPEGCTWLRVADVGEALAPLVEVIPAQLLAGHLAALEDVDGDSFRLDDEGWAAAWRAHIKL